MPGGTLFPNTPPLTAAIEALYAAFGAAYPCPDEFYSEHCCVTDEQARVLRETPLRDLDDEQVGHAMSHYGSCFGTLEQQSYFVPRAIEFYAVLPDGSGHGSAEWSVPRLIREGEPAYRAAGVWDALLAAVRAIFLDRTSRFALERPGDWWLRGGYEPNSEVRNQLVEHYFHPWFSVEPASPDDLAGLGYSVADGAQYTGWVLFFAQWAADECPARAAHLLDVVREVWWHGAKGIEVYELPQSFRHELGGPALQERLLLGAQPAFRAADADLWEEAVWDALAALHQERRLAAGG